MCLGAIKNNTVTDLNKTELKALIESEIAAVEAEIPRIEEQARPVSPDNAIGRLTRMEAIIFKIHQRSEPSFS